MTLLNIAFIYVSFILIYLHADLEVLLCMLFIVLILGLYYLSVGVVVMQYRDINILYFSIYYDWYQTICFAAQVIYSILSFYKVWGNFFFQLLYVLYNEFLIAFKFIVLKVLVFHNLRKFSNWEGTLYYFISSKIAFKWCFTLFFISSHCIRTN